MSNQPATDIGIEKRTVGPADIDLDALLAGTHFASLDACLRDDLLALNFSLDVDALVASGFAGDHHRGMALAA